jgi:hypothetical protein
MSSITLHASITSKNLPDGSFRIDIYGCIVLVELNNIAVELISSGYLLGIKLFVWSRQNRMVSIPG